LLTFSEIGQRATKPG